MKSRHPSEQGAESFNYQSIINKTEVLNRDAYEIKTSSEQGAESFNYQSIINKTEVLMKTRHPSEQGAESFNHQSIINKTEVLMKTRHPFEQGTESFNYQSIINKTEVCIMKTRHPFEQGAESFNYQSIINKTEVCIMKQSIVYSIIGVLVGIFVAQSAIAQSPGESDVPRTISYQGMVSSATGARFPSGDYAVTVRLYADEYGREAVWEGEYTTTVENGLLNLELGSGAYPLPGSSAMDRSLWIGIQVEDGPEMTPRTRLSAVPYALTVPDGSVTSDKLGVDYVSSIMIDGEKVTRKGSSLNITGGEGIDLRYDRLGGSMQIDLRRRGEDRGTTGDGEKGGSTQTPNSVLHWSEGGNRGTRPGTNYVGTSDAVELEIHVNSGNRTANAGDKRVMLYDPQPSSPNLIGGYQGNLPDTGSAIEGATIGGGGKNNRVNEVKDNYGTIGGGAGNVAGGFTVGTANDPYATVGGGYWNEAQGDYTTVGGGYANRAEGNYSTVGGGAYNQAEGNYATVGGGRENQAQEAYSTVGGGAYNQAEANYATVGGGAYNQAEAENATVGGGAYNQAEANYATVGGGDSNIASGLYSTVGGGKDNQAQAENATVGGGEDNQAKDDYGTIGGGAGNVAGGLGTTSTTDDTYATVGGGRDNQAEARYATVGGGDSNIASGLYSTVGGGRENQAQELGATVGGGFRNQAKASFATVGGGDSNTASGRRSTVGGGWKNQAQELGATVGGGKYNLAQLGFSTVGGGWHNEAQGHSSTVGGGRWNQAQGHSSTVGGGFSNEAQGWLSTVGGGFSNEAEGENATVGGGWGNEAQAYYSTVGGGRYNDAEAEYSTVGGGDYNQAEAEYATVGGGWYNRAGGPYSSIPGGDNLRAQSWAQTVLGAFNIPKGNVNRHYEGNPDKNEPIVIVGNGENDSTRSNAFEVSYNGHSIVFDQNMSGTARGAVKGGTYIDNIVYGWAEVNVVAGEITSCGDFGVSSISRYGPGIYRVTLNLVGPDGVTPAYLNCGAIVATLGTGIGPRGVLPAGYGCAQIVTSDIVNNVFDVFILQKPSVHVGQGSDCDIGVDMPFKFHVTGRVTDKAQ